MPVVKTDGSISICGDYKVTVNQAAKLDTYPLPRANDLFASLAGGKTFTTLVQEAGMHQHTHKGLYAYNRCHLGYYLPHPFFSVPWKASCKE